MYTIDPMAEHHYHHASHQPNQLFSGFTDGNADSYFNYHGPHSNFDPTHPDGYVIGNPGYEMQFWHRQSGNDCDIVAQQMRLESLTARHFSEAALLHEDM